MAGHDRGDTSVGEGDSLERGRAAYERRAWADAYAALAEADQRQPLAVPDLELLAWAAALSGRDDDLLPALERLFHAHADAGHCAQAARTAFLLGFRLLAIGEMGRAGGWLSRAQRQVDQAGTDCAERGYLLIPQAHRCLMTGDYDGAHDLSGQAVEIGERFDDADLVAFARNLQGRALVRAGQMEQGLALIDEAMLATTADELSPLFTGLVYCSVIATCHQVYALERAREWTSALARWCESQPQLVTFTGSCLVHRAEVMVLGGSWSEAASEARQVCERFSNARNPEAVGDGYYQQGEVFRLRGELEQAERCYREASRFGCEPQPGLALLRLAQGDRDAAAAAIRRVLEGTTQTFQRGRYLPAYVEIMLAAGELDAARQGTVELADLARAFDSEVVRAIAGHASASLKLAEGDAAGAVAPLREAFGVWRRVGAPYLAARVRAQLGKAYRALGDEDGARLEIDAARQVFEELGAKPDLAPVDGAQAKTASAAHGLTSRELEVLRLVASGSTNKAIAAALGISDRTVDRHISNMFLKLGLTSRSAATAFAYEHGLV